MAKESDRLPGDEAEGRMRAILRGAFSGPPTPLKDIPTRSGESRKLARKPAPKGTVAKPAKAKTAKPGP